MRVETPQRPLALEQAPSWPQEGRRTSHERLSSWMAAEVVVDIVTLALAALTFGLVLGTTPAPPAAAWQALAFSILVVGILGVRGLYRPRLRLQMLDSLPPLAVAAAAAAMVLISAHVLLGNEPYASWTVHYWLFATAWLAAGRAVLHMAHLSARS